MENQRAGEKGRWEQEQCCLCGQPLAHSAAVVLVLSTSVDSLDASQNLCAHGRCLKNHLAIDAPLISEWHEPAAHVGGTIGPGIMECLAQYVAVLQESAEATQQSEDRQKYERHLAQAARMFEAARRDPSLKKLSTVVADERRAFGWSFLAGDEGARAEREFDRFAKVVEERAV